MTTIVQLGVRIHNTRVQLNMRIEIKYVSNLPALANISSASVFKPVSKNGSQGVCKVVLNWSVVLPDGHRTLCPGIWYLNHTRPQPTLHIRTLYRRTFASRLAGNDAYLFSALVYRRAIQIDAASVRSDCTGTLLLVLCVIGYCKSIAQRIRVFLNVIEIRTNIGNKTNNKQEHVTVFT